MLVNYLHDLRYYLEVTKRFKIMYVTLLNPKFGRVWKPRKWSENCVWVHCLCRIIIVKSFKYRPTLFLEAMSFPK